MVMNEFAMKVADKYNKWEKPTNVEPQVDQTIDFSNLDFESDNMFKIKAKPDPTGIEKLTDIPIKSPVEGLKQKPRHAAMSHFQSDAGGGFTDYQTAGIVGNLDVESGGFDPDVLSGKRRGDKGRAIGVAQWRKARQEDFKVLYGKPIENATYEEQLAFITHELTQGKEQRAGKALRNAKTAKEAAEIIDRMYERSSGEHIDRRITSAEGML